ncbi:MAG: protein-export membrane protein SecD [Clostridiales bacterium GWE2_32_10]|nr:MAG: protein-export membrane protein SecD [Clostridiales bacterium GWE2_32_10]HBY21144.1 protein translocase subunit SecD [Clostridiales bacterium]
MKSKSLLLVIGTLLAIALFGFLVLSDKVITIGMPEKVAETPAQTTKEAQAPTASNQQQPATDVARPAQEPIAKEATINEQQVNVVNEQSTPAVEKTTEGQAQTTVTPPATEVQTVPVKPTPAAAEDTTITPPATTQSSEKAETTKETKKQPIKIQNPLSYKNINLGLDLKGGVSIVYQADVANPSKQDMDSAVELLRRRLNAKNYTEAEVSLQGSNRIRVEIPGIGDPNQAVNEIGRTAELKFYGLTKEQEQAIKESSRNDAEALLKNMGIEPTYEQISQLAYMNYVKGIQDKGDLVLRGKDIESAAKSFEQTAQVGPMEPVIMLKMTSEGAKKFADATRKYKGSYIAILLDNDMLSIPKVNDEIDAGTAVITGMNSEKEATTTAELINSGALPFKLKDIQRTAIEARLGQDALAGSIFAGIVGAGFIVLFMVVIFRFPGLVADMALMAYVFLVLAVYSLFDVTLTLPGIAGMILSVGIAVDANVIIFSRIKEELNAGKTTRAAITAGFHKAMNAVMDGNVAAFIIALILYWQGTGPIKGFGQTLMIGILVSLFTAIVVTRYLLNAFVDLGVKNPTLYGAKRKLLTVGDLNKK